MLAMNKHEVHGSDTCTMVLFVPTHSVCSQYTTSVCVHDLCKDEI